MSDMYTRRVVKKASECHLLCLQRHLTHVSMCIIARWPSGVNASWNISSELSTYSPVSTLVQLDHGT